MESSKIKNSKVGEFSFWSTHYSWQSFDLDMDGAFPSGVRANLLLALMLASARRQDCTKSKSAPWNCMVVVFSRIYCESCGRHPRRYHPHHHHPRRHHHHHHHHQHHHHHHHHHDHDHSHHHHHHHPHHPHPYPHPHPQNPPPPPPPPSSFYRLLPSISCCTCCSSPITAMWFEHLDHLGSLRQRSGQHSY